MHQNPFSFSAQDPAGGALRRSPRPYIVGWGGRYPPIDPIPLPARRLRRLELSAYGPSVLRPPQHKILATSVSEDLRAVSHSRELLARTIRVNNSRE